MLILLVFKLEFFNLSSESNYFLLIILDIMVQQLNF